MSFLVLGDFCQIVASLIKSVHGDICLWHLSEILHQ